MRPFYKPWEKELIRVTEEQKLVLNEGLIKTYPPMHIIHDMEKSFKITRNYFNILADNVIQIQTKNDITSNPEFDRLLSLNGYLYSNKSFNGKNYLIQIEPKLPSIAAGLPDYVYHVTPSTNMNKINRIGLTPKESKTSFNHNGERIYLLISNDPMTDLLTLVTILRDNRSLYNRIQNDIEYTALKIKTNIDDRMYYYDPMFDWAGNTRGVFTLKNIPPKDIEIIGTIK